MRRLAQLLAAVSALVLAALTCQPAVEPNPVDVPAPAPVPTKFPELPTEGPPVEPKQPQRVSRHVLVVGDSEACAVSGYAKETAEAAGDTVDVVCKGSTTVQDWSGARLTGALSSHPSATSIVVFLGTNHYLDAKAPPVGPILDMVNARGLDCVWVGNTPVMGKARKINGLMRAAVSSTCTYFDTEAFGVELRDGIHPTPAAARRWIQAVWSTIPARFAADE